ncbi:MAG: hypothetical protein ACREQ5_08400, partial [Candidatus Dormibacteria bacterium]
MTRATAYLPLCGVAAALVVSCGTSTTAQPPAPSQTPSDSVAGAIAPARTAQCGTIGPQVARYLETGDNGGHPELDTQYAQDLRYILNSPRQAQPGLIRLDANQATAACDKAADDATAAQARAVAERQQLDQEQAAQLVADRGRAKEQAMCPTLAGKWEGVTGGGYACDIDYRSPGDGQNYHYSVSFDSAGNVTPGSVPNATACTTYYGPGLTGRWHLDTDI